MSLSLFTIRDNDCSVCVQRRRVKEIKIIKEYKLQRLPHNNQVISVHYLGKTLILLSGNLFLHIRLRSFLFQHRNIRELGIISDCFPVYESSSIRWTSWQFNPFLIVNCVFPAWILPSVHASIRTSRVLLSDEENMGRDQEIVSGTQSIIFLYFISLMCSLFMCTQIDDPEQWISQIEPNREELIEWVLRIHPFFIFTNEQQHISKNSVP